MGSGATSVVYCSTLSSENEYVLKIFCDETESANDYLKDCFNNERAILEKIGNEPVFCNLVKSNEDKLSLLMQPVGLPIKMDIFDESMVFQLLGIMRKLFEKNVSPSFILFAKNDLLLFQN